MSTHGSVSGRVVLAKVGLDGHDVGVKLVGKRLMAAGFEVVYLGKRLSTEHIVSTAIAEDVDVIGLSGLSGGLGHFAVKVIERVRDTDAAIPVIAGGIDEPGEIERMLAAGVYRYFGPGAESTEIVESFVSAARAES